MPGLYMILCGPNILLCILCLVFVSFVLRYGHFLDISVISCIALLNRYTYVNYRYLYLPSVYSGLSTNTIMKDLNKNRNTVIPCIRCYILILTVKITVTKTPTSGSSVTLLSSQGLVAIFLLFVIFHIMYDYTIKGANDEKIKC